MVNVDINILRTFIEVANTRHFGKAAANLFITQAAVSARIKLLEDQLSVQLFKRERNNIQLTRHGEKLVSFANSILEIWSEATQEVCAPDDYYDLSIAAPKSIWSSKIYGLPNQLFAAHRKLHLTIDSVDSESIAKKLMERSLDFGFLYEPPRQSDIRHEALFDIELMVFATDADARIEDITSTRFVSVDLGLSFKRILGRLVPGLSSVVFQAYDWEMALDYLKDFGGFALLPVDVARHSQVPLYPLQGFEPVKRTVYLCYNQRIVSEEVKREMIDELAQLLNPLRLVT